MEFNSSTTCLVDHDTVSDCLDSHDWRSGCCNEANDWDSYSSHSATTSSSSSSYPSSSSTPSSHTSSPSSSPPHPHHRPQQQPEHHHHHHHQQQQQPPPPPPSPRCHHRQEDSSPVNGLMGEQEVMFYNSTKALWDSLAYVTSMTEMCDVVFHVGRSSRQPVYGVKSLLSVRSRVMYLRILQEQRTSREPRKNNWRRLHCNNHKDLARADGRVHIDVTDYDVTVFSQMIGFLHSGRVTVDVDTALGLYCAASEYEIPDLRTACRDFVDRCAQRGHAHSLVTSGRPYLGRKALERLSGILAQT